MTVRAKLTCVSKVTLSGGSTSLMFVGTSPDHDKPNENQVFNDYTPNIRLEMTIAAGRPAADEFEEGLDYYADLIVAIVVPEPGTGLLIGTPTEAAINSADFENVVTGEPLADLNGEDAYRAMRERMADADTRAAAERVELTAADVGDLGAALNLEGVTEAGHAAAQSDDDSYSKAYEGALAPEMKVTGTTIDNQTHFDGYVAARDNGATIAEASEQVSGLTPAALIGNTDPIDLKPL